MGGKRQANVLSALIQNFDTVEEAIEASAGSAGSALRENEVFLDSFEGRMQQLTAAAQSKWSEALDTDTIKDAIQLFTKFVETLDVEDSALLDVVNLLIKSLSGLMDLIGDNNLLYTLVAFFGANAIRKNGWGDFFTGLKKSGEETIESLTDGIRNLDAEITSLTEKANSQSGRAQRKTLQSIDAKKQLRAEKQKRLDEMKLSAEEQREVAESFDVSKIQKKISGKKGAITKRTKSLEAQGVTPEQIQADPKIQQWNKDIKDGQQALEEYNNKIRETDASLDQVNASTGQSSGTTTNNTGVQNANTGAQAANAAARRGVGAQTDAQTQDVNENTAATEQNTNAQNQNTRSLGGKAVKLKEFGAQIMQTVAYMAILQGAMQLIDGIAWGLGEAWNAMFPKKKTFEDLHDEFEQLASELSEEKSELKGLEGKLEDVKSQIENIQALGTLSFTKQEELKNLQKQSAELERQVEMQEMLAKNKQRGTNAAALSAANAYLQQSAETDKTLEEAAEKTKETGQKVGSIVDGALMVGGAILMIATGWTGAGAIAGGAMVAAGMAGAGRGIGGAIGKSAGENNYQKQQTNKQAINTYESKRADYQNRLSQAYASQNSEEYNKIKEEYDKFEVMMADNIGGLMEYLNSVDYKTLTDVEKADYEAFQKIVNQYSLQNGGSITNAVDNILGYDRYEKTGYEMDQIQKSLKKGEISEEDAKSQIKALITPELEKEFNDLGISVGAVVDSYVQLGVAARDNASIMDSLGKISAVTNAFDDLGAAVKEFREEGYASAGTLDSLNEKFGKIDGFEELYKVLATGEGDLESAVTNVANAYVGQVGALSDMTDDELAIMSSRLKALGVLNAEEVLMARQKGQAQLDALGLAYSIDLSNYGTAEQAKLAIAQAAGLDIASIADNQIESLAKKYGVDLQNYASIEEKKIAIAQARAKAEAQTDRNKLEKEYRSGDIDYTEYQTGLTDINNSLNFDSMSSTIQGIINSAYQGFKFDFDGQIGIGSDFDEDWGESKAEEKTKEEWEKLVNKYENQLALITNERDLIESEIDKAEARGGKASTKYYEALKKNSEDEKTLLMQKKAALEEYLAANAGVIDQDTWTDYNNEINATAVAIKECEINTIEWAEAIREVDLHYFEQASDEISRLGEELELVSGLLEDEEVADENGNWSSAALTRIGIYTNQMEMAAANAARYQDEIDKLNAEYEHGSISEEQYQERLSDLVGSQQDAIMSYEDAKDGIVELNEARIEAIREGIEKEIEAYEDLIDAKKEELDAERDLYGFRKNIQKQTRDISELERRIASLSGSSAASDVAERRRLEAQLMEAKEGLNDAYYDHSRDAQSTALDEENRAYALSKEKYIESLEEQLKDAETLIQNSIMDVMLNADMVYNELNTLADTYGVTLSDELTQPWKDASAQATAWKNELQASMTSGEYAALIGEGGAVTAFANGVATKLQGSWTKAQTAANNYAGYLTGEELKNKFSNTLTGFGDQIQGIIDKWNGVKAAADAAYVAQTRTASVGGGGSGSGSGDNTGGNTTGNVQPTPPPVARVDDRILNKYKLTSSQILDLGYGPITLEEFERLLRNYQIKYSAVYKQVANTRDIERSLKKVMYGEYVSGPLAVRKYAKGTIGTTRDEWAVDSEPWLGDELVLVPTESGNLSYMRKGTGVVPADLTANLMEWGQFTPDAMNLGGGVNVNMINNAVNKPEFNFTFDALVKAERIDENTLPEVKRFVQQEINSLVKQMNYAIKGKGGR